MEENLATEDSEEIFKVPPKPPRLIGSIDKPILPRIGVEAEGEEEGADNYTPTAAMVIVHLTLVLVSWKY